MGLCLRLQAAPRFILGAKTELDSDKDGTLHRALRLPVE